MHQLLVCVCIKPNGIAIDQSGLFYGFEIAIEVMDGCINVDSGDARTGIIKLYQGLLKRPQARFQLEPVALIVVYHLLSPSSATRYRVRRIQCGRDKRGL